MSRVPSTAHGHGTGRRGDCPGRRAALLRVLIAVLLALPLLAGTVVAGPSAAAAPGDDGETDAERPVRIDVSRIEPGIVAPGGAIALTMTLTNTGEESLSGLSVRLQRADPVRTRADLLAAGADPELGRQSGVAVAQVFELPEMLELLRRPRP